MFQCLNLAAQCLRLHTFNAGDEVSIPGRGTKILQATWYRPIPSKKKKKKKKKRMYFSNAWRKD